MYMDAFLAELYRGRTPSSYSFPTLAARSSGQLPFFPRLLLLNVRRLRLFTVTFPFFLFFFCSSCFPSSPLSQCRRLSGPQIDSKQPDAYDVFSPKPVFSSFRSFPAVPFRPLPPTPPLSTKKRQDQPIRRLKHHAIRICHLFSRRTFSRQSRRFLPATLYSRAVLGLSVAVFYYK